MISGRIIVAGIGPGSAEDITQAVVDAAREVDVVIGYKPYFRYIKQYIKPSAECVDTGMRQETERARMAFEHAEAGKAVLVISSGDAGIYGMAPLIYEMVAEKGFNGIDIITLPGISAFQKAAAILGAPVGHDTCIISLSDLMTPWETIEKRIRAAAAGDFVTAIYNPRSHGRYWQLARLKEIFLSEGRSEETPVGIVREAGREDESYMITTLGSLDVSVVDMVTVVIIGNSETYARDGKMITPRGYISRLKEEDADIAPGQNIMINSFQTIEHELKNKDIPTYRKWTLLHAIHATADFDMENILYTDEGAVETMYKALSGGRVKTIVTDVSMVASGIRKGALARLGINVKTYIADPRTAERAKADNTTRAQAGMRIAAEEHPDALYVFGNAPTALMELCEQIRHGKAHPAGVIAAPVGFVHVRESKYMIKTFTDIPKIIIEGRKGGSGLAAALTNSVLCYDDAEEIWPGRDV